MKNITTLSGEVITSKEDLFSWMTGDGQGSGSSIGNFLINGEKQTIYKHWSNEYISIQDFKTTIDLVSDNEQKTIKTYGTNIIGEIEIKYIPCVDKNGNYLKVDGREDQILHTSILSVKYDA